LPKKTALSITTAGADYYLALKDNQPTLYAHAKEKLDHLPAAWTSPIECDHGRIEHRELRLVAFDSEISDFPGARQLASITRYYQYKTGGEMRPDGVKTAAFVVSPKEQKTDLYCEDLSLR
jgi:hypothetical protein